MVAAGGKVYENSVEDRQIRSRVIRERDALYVKDLLFHAHA